MPNLKFKLSIQDDRFSSGSENLYFSCRKTAKAVKDRIWSTALEHKENRPNNHEKRFMTVEHDLGELTFKVENIEKIHLFHQQEAIESDQENRNNDVKNQAPMFAEAVKACFDKLIGK